MTERRCDYCGLPLVGRVAVDPGRDAGADRGGGDRKAHAYCCIGCRFAAAIVANGEDGGPPRASRCRRRSRLALSSNALTPPWESIASPVVTSFQRVVRARSASTGTTARSHSSEASTLTSSSSSVHVLSLTPTTHHPCQAESANDQQQSAR